MAASDRDYALPRLLGPMPHRARHTATRAVDGPLVCKLESRSESALTYEASQNTERRNGRGGTPRISPSKGRSRFTPRFEQPANRPSFPRLFHCDGNGLGQDAGSAGTYPSPHESFSPLATVTPWKGEAMGVRPPNRFKVVSAGCHSGGKAVPLKKLPGRSAPV